MRPGRLLLPPGSLLFLAWLPLSTPAFYTDVHRVSRRVESRVQVKPGICPDLQHEQTPPRPHCLLDTSCPGREKCCKTSDGQQCAYPQGVFSGYCPNVDFRPAPPSTCGVDCHDDHDCFGDLPRKKCCRFGHWRLCLEAIEEHPGVCPLRGVVQTFVPCEHTCSDDRTCPLHQKCCFTGCSRGCLDSVRSKECRLPYEAGPCRAAFVRYYYDVDQKRCLTFTYGGCHGNSNNFQTKEDCEKACGEISPEVCEQPAETGLCKGYNPRYYYDSASNSCKDFIYGGCGGNGNRFHTRLECLLACGKPGTCKVQ